MMSMDSVLTRIRIKYNELTNVEQTIADYFLNYPPVEDLSLKKVTDKLFVSKASLSRFAKELGYDGFREFTYQYRLERKALKHDEMLPSASVTVFDNYQYILSESIKQIDDHAIQEAVKSIHSSKQIIIYGDGMSGFAASEFMVRFKRLGFSTEVFTTDFLMHLNSTSLSSETLVIGITLSGNTRNTIGNLNLAHEAGAKTILITANHALKEKYNFDIIICTVDLPHMNTGINISPQVPILIIIDLLFNNCLKMNPQKYLRKYNETISALRHNWINPNQ